MVSENLYKSSAPLYAVGYGQHTDQKVNGLGKIDNYIVTPLYLC